MPRSNDLPLAPLHTDLFIIERLGRLHIRGQEDLHRITDHRQRAQQQPENKGEVKQKELGFEALGHPFGFPDTVHGAELRMIDHDIHREAVAVGRDDAGDHEEAGPEHHKQCLQDQQPEQPRHHAEAVQHVPEVRGVLPNGIQRENGEAHAHDGEREMQKHIDQRLARAGHGARHELHGGFRSPLGRGLKNSGHVFISHAGQAQREEADQHGKEREDQPGRDQAGL